MNSVQTTKSTIGGGGATDSGGGGGTPHSTTKSPERQYWSNTNTVGITVGVVVFIVLGACIAFLVYWCRKKERKGECSKSESHTLQFSTPLEQKSFFFQTENQRPMIIQRS